MVPIDSLERLIGLEIIIACQPLPLDLQLLLSLAYLEEKIFKASLSLNREHPK